MVKKYKKLKSYKRWAFAAGATAIAGQAIFMFLGFAFIRHLHLPGIDHKPEIQILLKLDDLVQLVSGFFSMQFGLFLFLAGAISFNSVFLYQFIENILRPTENIDDKDGKTS